MRARREGFSKKLEGGCQVPIAAYARLEDKILVMEGLVGSVVGDIIIKEKIEGTPSDAEALGLAWPKDCFHAGRRRYSTKSMPGTMVMAHQKIKGDIAS